ncbi:MAG TPA: tRNA (guanosine(37)-N1)-methyltransferase TrmD [Streptosporangiaceae bacterium]|nr:tRNA (guanosine(37)-N1)-methyltransferase TrmD [Streptosporangiaceae bacterium]
MRIDIITIFPEYFGPLSVSLIGKAAERGDISFAVRDLRDWTYDVHHTVDDSPFGGGPGMVMKPEPWGEALDAIAPAGTDPLLVIPTPAGRPFSQQQAARYAAEPWLIFACGRYEGIDGRVADDARSRMRVEEVSIGDYVLAGGEPAVLVMTEAICRLLPGVLGNADSAADDSFGFGAGLRGDRMAGLVEGPAYTRPRVWRDRQVPPVLLSGDHGAIARWRRDSALRRTARNRPDLVWQLLSADRALTAGAAADQAGLLDEQDRAVLAEAGFPVTGEDVAH